MKTIAVVNQKGGAGKTTTALLLCRALADNGACVLAIDTDPQATFTKLSGVNAGLGLFSCLSGTHDLTQVIYKVNSFYLVPASIELRQVFTSVSKNELCRLLAGEKNYDYCIIDTPPNLEGLTQAAIETSDLVVVSCEASEPALSATLYTVNQIKKTKKPYKVIIAGYKEPKPDSKAYKNNLMWTYKQAINGFVAIPRTMATAKQASTPRTTKKSKAELYPLLRGLIA